MREHGFEWISSGPNRGAYRHALFSKIDPSKCKQIIRLVSHKKQTTDKTFDNKPPAQADASKRVYQHYFDREPETNSGDVEPPGTRRQKRTYYDSDNSYEPLSEEKPVETIDWDDHANQTWGRKQLIKGLGDFERSALLCLATTHATEEDADELRESPCRQSPQFQDPKHENPLVPLDSSPLPLSHLNYFISRSSKVPGFAEKLYRSFGDSALVAIGMILEEMLTASLLPLAGLHVLRCRELENKHSSGEDAETHVPSLEENRLLLNPINGQAIESRCTVLKGAETPFEEWTLPPDEACFKLLEQGFMPRNGVPLVQEPTREMPASVVNGAKLDRQETSIRNWMETQEVDPNFVAENSEVFRLFISGDLPPVQKKRRK